MLSGKDEFTKMKYEEDDDPEDGVCMCQLCWKYGWHRSVPWYLRIYSKIEDFWNFKIKNVFKTILS